MYCFVIFEKGLRSVFDESSQTDWFFATLSNIYRYIPNQLTQNLGKVYTRIFRMNHSIYWWKPQENPCSSVRVHRGQTDRRGGWLCFIICIDKTDNMDKNDNNNQNKNDNVIEAGQSYGEKVIISLIWGSYVITC